MIFTDTRTFNNDERYEMWCEARDRYELQPGERSGAQAVRGLMHEVIKRGNGWVRSRARLTEGKTKGGNGAVKQLKPGPRPIKLPPNRLADWYRKGGHILARDRQDASTPETPSLRQPAASAANRQPGAIPSQTSPEPRLAPIFRAGISDPPRLARTADRRPPLRRSAPFLSTPFQARDLYLAGTIVGAVMACIAIAIFEMGVF